MMLPKLNGGVSRGLVQDACERGALPSIAVCVNAHCKDGHTHEKACSDGSTNGYLAYARAGYGIANSCGGNANIDGPMQIFQYGTGHCEHQTGNCAN